MADIQLSEAAAVLRDHFGMRVVGGRDEGRDLMCEVLKERLDLPGREAKKTVEALERAHSIEYVEGVAGGGDFVHAEIPFAEARGVDNPAGPGTSAETPLRAGYWQL
ncbi:MAG: hypothetical protein M3220_11020 [Chloroflexota bacterium]|nr:hypothetical protein [Chloroflexota bacterium]